MEDHGANKNYLFGYDYRASARLDLQHFLIKQQIGHLLHPTINLPKENCQIVDIGAGTCIWSVECARQLSPSTKFDCFDISPAHYPPQSFLPKNISLHLHDAFTPFPSEFHGKYDLVNIRLFVCVVQHDDPSTLITNLAALLKPGGYIQWIEHDATSLQMIHAPDQVEPSDAVQRIHEFMANPLPNLRFTWIPILDAHLRKGGLTDVRLEKYPTDLHLESFYNRLKLLTCEEAISLMPVSEETRRLQESLGEAYVQMRDGGAGLTSGLVLVLGRRPG